MKTMWTLVVALAIWPGIALSQGLPFGSAGPKGAVEPDQTLTDADSKDFQINKLFSCDVAGSCTTSIYKTGKKERIVLKYFACFATTTGTMYFAAVQDKQSGAAAGVVPQTNGDQFWAGTQSINLIFGPQRNVQIGLLASAPITSANCTISGIRE